MWGLKAGGGPLDVACLHCCQETLSFPLLSSKPGPPQRPSWASRSQSSRRALALKKEAGSLEGDSKGRQSVQGNVLGQEWGQSAAPLSPLNLEFFSPVRTQPPLRPPTGKPGGSAHTPFLCLGTWTAGTAVQLHSPPLLRVCQLAAVCEGS